VRQRAVPAKFQGRVGSVYLTGVVGGIVPESVPPPKRSDDGTLGTGQHAVRMLVIPVATPYRQARNLLTFAV
jgi:hypothetical protein